MDIRKIELLAPAGDREKLETAVHFGADAVYFAGKNYGLRAYGTNFDIDEIKSAVAFLHANNKKAYVTLNVYARHKDFDGLEEYVKSLVDAKIDAVLISDLGIFSFVHSRFPELAIHISTQANTTNAEAAKMWYKLGAERVVLARELNLDEIKTIAAENPELELEVFVHGAMCISYSGRCLLSNYLTGRDSNHGECVQACRWKYSVIEESRPNEVLDLTEDTRGTYIFNSKDLCLIEHLDKLYDAGVTSMKVEGRMKSPYYVGTVINAYRRAIDLMLDCKARGMKFKLPKELKAELLKASHRDYTTGFVVESSEPTQKYDSSSQEQESQFVAIVKKTIGKRVFVEQRNKFAVGDQLEILSPTDTFNKVIKIEQIKDESGLPLQEAKQVQQIVEIECSEKLEVGDILRKSI